MTALRIRDDLSADELRRRARAEGDGRVAARMFAIAHALDGMRREQAARLAGMDRQVLRDWVVRYNAEGVAGLHNRPLPGPRPKLTEGEMATLRGIILRPPAPAKDGTTRWRMIDLCRVVEERFGVSYCETGMWRLVRSLELSFQKARPRHPQADLKAQTAFKGGIRRHPE
jgi:transposase